MAGKEELKVDEDKEGGGKKKLIIIIAAVSLVLVIGGVSAFFFLGGEDEALNAEPEMAQSTYYKLEKPFVVNFQAGRRQRFLQIDVAFKSKSEEAIEVIKKHTPVIKNDLNQLFGDQTLESLQEAGGRQRLNDEATAKVKEILQREMGEPGIEQVLFTDFVMQ